MDEPLDPPPASHMAIAYSSARVFRGDGRIDLRELELLLAIALEDHKITEAERHTLRQVFERAEEAELEKDVREKIAAFRRQYRI